MGRDRLAAWLVPDGAYAKRDVLKSAKALGGTVVSRLRKDAAPPTLHGPNPAGQRGPAPTYGAKPIDLAKRACQKRGWSRCVFELHNGTAVERYKIFLATWRPAGARPAGCSTLPR